MKGLLWYGQLATIRLNHTRATKNAFLHKEFSYKTEQKDKLRFFSSFRVVLRFHDSRSLTDPSVYLGSCSSKERSIENVQPVTTPGCSVVPALNRTKNMDGCKVSGLCIFASAFKKFF